MQAERKGRFVPLACSGVFDGRSSFSYMTELGERMVNNESNEMGVIVSVESDCEIWLGKLRCIMRS